MPFRSSQYGISTPALGIEAAELVNEVVEALASDSQPFEQADSVVYGVPQ